MTEARDDVIRIRLDTGRAIEAFLTPLAEQATAGDFQDPVEPAATAVWRQLAPFRLVEYAYVDPGLGPAITGAYVGFPDGSLYAAATDIPDAAVAALVVMEPPPPLYLYLPLEQAEPLDRIETFLEALSAHLSQPLVGVLRGEGGHFVARLFDADVTHAALAEAGRHVGCAALLGQIVAQTHRPDGRAYASLFHAFHRRVIEFPSVEARDGFIAWTQAVCDWVFAHGGDAEALGFPEALRPAEIARVPDDPETPVSSPPSLGLDNLASVDAMRAAWTELHLKLV